MKLISFLKPVTTFALCCSILVTGHSPIAKANSSPNMKKMLERHILILYPGSNPRASCGARHDLRSSHYRCCDAVYLDNGTSQRVKAQCEVERNGSGCEIVSATSGHFCKP